MRNKTILAIGGGKGGVGKSTISANLAIEIAAANGPTLIIDADYTSSNLHTLYGILRPKTTLNDFLCGKLPTLDKACIEVERNLFLLSGASSVLSLQEPTFRQREQLFSALSRLAVGTIIVDLPAGAHREALDFFLAADHRITVIEPTPLSVENAYLFLKNPLYRRLFRLFHNSPESKTRIAAAMNGAPGHPASYADLLAALSEINPSVAVKLKREAALSRYWLIVNKYRGEESNAVGTTFCQVAAGHLGITVEHLASIAADANVNKSLLCGEPLHRACPDTPFLSGIKNAALQLCGRTAAV